MIKFNLQLFAHKKGMGSTKNGRESQSKIHFSLSLTVRSSMSVWARIRSRLAFIL